MMHFKMQKNVYNNQPKGSFISKNIGVLWLRIHELLLLTLALHLILILPLTFPIELCKKIVR